MTGEWYNNRIGKKLYEDYPHDFSICDIDGLVRFSYWSDRMIIYESKNERESISRSQLTSLRKLDSAIDWSRFDDLSGAYIIKIVDIDTDLRWYNLQGHLIFRTTFDELYNIFSGKDVRGEY